MKTPLELEKLLLEPKVRQDKKMLDTLIHDDFIEVSQSGKKYDKAVVLEDVPSSHQTYTAYHFMEHFLSSTVCHITYESLSENTQTGEIKEAYRSSIWVLNNNQWQMIYHQGTPKK